MDTDVTTKAPSLRSEQHTPGPWKVHANVGRKGGLGVIADKAPCVIAHGFSEKHWPEIAEANARLIAAAPEMLALLRRAEVSLSPDADAAETCLTASGVPCRHHGCQVQRDVRALLARIDQQGDSR